MAVLVCGPKFSTAAEKHFVISSVTSFVISFVLFNSGFWQPIISAATIVNAKMIFFMVLWFYELSVNLHKYITFLFSFQELRNLYKYFEVDKEKFNFVGYELKVYIMKKLIVLLAIMSLGLSGCQMQEFDVVVTDSKDTFTASVEVLDSPTKTAMTPDRNVVWSAEDRVAIFRKSTLADEYVVSAASVGKTSAVLEPVVMDYPGTGDFYAGMEIPCNIAYYPYSGDLTVSGVSLKEENTSNVNSYRISNILLPRIQEYSPKTFSNGCFPMVAITESASDTDLKFRNLLGVLKLQ
jgi:hypothetical protein